MSERGKSASSSSSREGEGDWEVGSL